MRTLQGLKNHRRIDKEYRKRKRIALEEIHKIVQEVYDWRKINPNGHRAHKIVARALIKGLIIKGECLFKDDTCSEIIQAHHENYKKPMAVNWLCASHHKKVDLGILKI